MAGVRRKVVALTLLLAGAVAAGSSRPAAKQSTSVRGGVEIGIPTSARRPATPYRRTIGGRPLAPPSERQHVVVYLKDAQAQAVTPMKAQILQRSETFLPRVVAVTVGSEVEFPNDDPIYHNVFSLSRVRQFNLGRYPRGETRSQRFDRPGIVKVFCDIHSHMSATVMVFDHPWFAIPDADGNFTLNGVPPGDRQVTAWHERLGDTTIDVRVEGGRAAAADFVLPVPEP